MGAFLEAMQGNEDSNETTVLGKNVNLKGFAEAIKEDKVQNIITLAGAGISTSCGIPELIIKFQIFLHFITYTFKTNHTSTASDRQRLDYITLSDTRI